MDSRWMLRVLPLVGGRGNESWGAATVWVDKVDSAASPDRCALNMRGRSITVRRVISARDMSPKERRAYREETQKKTDVRE